MAAEVVVLATAVVAWVRDADTLLHLRRVAALAGVPVSVGDDMSATIWRAADAVILDLGAVSQVAGLPRRERLAVVAPAELDPTQWRAVVGLGAEAVLTLPGDERALADWLTRSRRTATRAGRVFGCVPARGGAGASTLAAVLACTAAERHDPVVLIDADPHAGGLDLLLGLDDDRGLRWPDVCGGRSVPWAELPTVAGVRVLSTSAARPVDVVDEEVARVVEEARADHGLVVVDLAAGAVPPAGASTAVLVVPAEVRAVAASAAWLRSVDVDADVRVVLRQPGAGGLRARDVEAALGIGVVETWRWQRRLDADIEAGRLAVTRQGAVRAVAERLLTGSPS